MSHVQSSDQGMLAVSWSNSDVALLQLPSTGEVTISIIFFFATGHFSSLVVDFFPSCDKLK